MRVRYTVTFEAEVERFEEVVMALKGLGEIMCVGRRCGMACVGIEEEVVAVEAARTEPRDRARGELSGKG